MSTIAEQLEKRSEIEAIWPLAKQTLPAVAVNARFLGQRVTGVQRYAREVLARLPWLEAITPGPNWSGPRGHAWEQTVLPGRSHGKLLWSPCNVGPWAVRRQVVTIHDCAFHDVPEAFSPSFRLWYRWLLKGLSQHVRRIITVSEFSRSRIIDFLGVDPERVVAIPNGVDRRFRPEAIERVGDVRFRLGLPERYVLYVGSLEPRKNLRSLLRAWERIGEKMAAELVICGASSHVFQRAGIESLPPGVRLSGYVSDHDLPALYAGSALTVYPSLYEGFGLPVLEAMACGAPVVCSGTTSLGEVAGDAALLVDPTDTESIAEGICRVAGDESLQNDLRQRGLARASQFDWDRTASQTWDVLSTAAEASA